MNKTPTLGEKCGFGPVNLGKFDQMITLLLISIFVEAAKGA
jgi:hypothetical protein